MRHWILLLTVFSQIVCLSQTGFKFAAVDLLTDRINSGGEEVMPILSPDRRTLYFVRSIHKSNNGGRMGGQDIWYSELLAPGEWSKSRKFHEFNNLGNNAIVGIDTSGTRVYLLNSYENKLGDKSGVSYSDLYKHKWSYPVVLPIKGVYNLGQSNVVYGLYVNAESDILMVSMAGPGSLGEEDLYVSFRFSGWNRFHQAGPGNDEEGFYWWSTPIHLGSVINSAGFELSPFLCADGITLFFSSSRPGGLGNADIYCSRRLDNTWKNWSEPINLGQEINSNNFDGYFFLSEKDSAVFYASARGGRFSDIYTTKLLEMPQDEPFNLSSIRHRPTGDSIKSIYFDHNSSSLLLKDSKTLESAMLTLKQNPRLFIELVGFADETERQNTLEEKRCVSVKNYLIENGIEGNRIIIVPGINPKTLINLAPSDSGTYRRVDLSFSSRN